MEKEFEPEWYRRLKEITKKEKTTEFVVKST